MRRMLSVSILLFAVLLASVAGAPVAGAAPPERFTEEFEDHLAGPHQVFEGDFSELCEALG